MNDEHSAIVKFQSLNSSSETTFFAYMTGTPEKVAKQFEEQARVQGEQLDMIRAQQESMDTLKKMLPRLLKVKKKSGRAHLLQTLRVKSIPILSHPNFHLKRRKTQRMKAVIPRERVNWSNVLKPFQIEVVFKILG